VATPTLCSSRLGDYLNRVRILMADDHSAVLERAAALLESEFEVVGTAANGRDLLNEAKRLQPDVVILEISMPLLDGIEAATILDSSSSKAKVIFLTSHDGVEFIHACFNAGAEAHDRASMALDIAGVASLVSEPFGGVHRHRPTFISMCE
jgi:DNA-binding NarL/FixJ family response regulator